jgi:hypothetical protein
VSGGSTCGFAGERAAPGAAGPASDGAWAIAAQQSAGVASTTSAIRLKHFDTPVLAAVDARARSFANRRSRIGHCTRHDDIEC